MKEISLSQLYLDESKIHSLYAFITLNYGIFRNSFHYIIYFQKMIQRLGQLFQSKSPFIKKLQTFSLLTERPVIDPSEIIFIVDAFIAQEQKSAFVKDFLHFINQHNAKSKSSVIHIKNLFLIHLLLGNLQIGKLFSDQMNSIKLLIQQQICKFIKSNKHKDTNLHQIQLIYAQYLMRYSQNWTEINLKPVFYETFLSFNFVNLSNIVLSLVPYLKKCNQPKSPLRQLIKQISLNLYMDVDMFCKQLKGKMTEELQNIEFSGEKIIEIQQLLIEINILTNKMVTFHEYILEFGEGCQISAPKPLTVSSKIYNELNLALNRHKIKGEHRKQIKLAYQQNEIKLEQSPDFSYETAKSTRSQQLFKRVWFSERKKEKVRSNLSVLSGQPGQRIVATSENEKDLEVPFEEANQ